MSQVSMLRKRVDPVAASKRGSKALERSPRQSRVMAKKARFNFQSETNRTKAVKPSRPKARKPKPEIPSPPPAIMQAKPTLPVSELSADTASAESVIIAEKVKELLQLAQDQGYLTYDDINDSLPDEIVTPEVLDEI